MARPVETVAIAAMCAEDQRAATTERHVGNFETLDI